MTARADTCQIRLPWPNKHLSPNARAHWAAKAKAAKKARHDAAACALEAGVRHIEAKSLMVKLVFFPPDNRHRDLDNLLASSKASLDGIADVCGVNDSLWAITMHKGEPIKGGAVHVEVTPL